MIRIGDLNPFQTLNIDLITIATGVIQMTAKTIGEADIVSVIEQDDAIEEVLCPEQWDVTATQYVPGLVWRTWKSRREAGKVLVAVSALETRGSKEINQK
jgi:hypothetical protein